MNPQPIPKIPKPADLTGIKDIVKSLHGIDENIFVTRKSVLWLIETVENLQKHLLEAAQIIRDSSEENQKLREICKGIVGNLN